MAEAEYSTTANLSADTIWAFVQDMDNWATYVVGYQSHEQHDDRHSTWTLKGDVGMLTRMLTFEVHITEWSGPERVRFTLKGTNEMVGGEGCFTLEPAGPEAASTSAAVVPAARPWWLRWLESIARFFYRWRHGTAERAPESAAPPGTARTRLTFQLRLEPGGPMAPMINALITPLLMPAAEDLANQIMGHLEREAVAR